MKYTPENIQVLEPNQVFVFGSNMAGEHVGGAAKIALEKFGAVHGLGEGYAGQSYAFPTLDSHYKKRSLNDLINSRSKLYQHAKDHPEKRYLVTKVGLGIAGFTLDEMRSVFTHEKPENVILPKEFS